MDNLLFLIATILGLMTVVGFLYIALEMYILHRHGGNGITTSLMFIALAMASSRVNVGYLSLVGQDANVVSYVWSSLNSIVIIVCIGLIVKNTKFKEDKNDDQQT